ncbi:MAG: hypothetical protein GY769_25580, partial [bacterium]|nr:hypothetical protein [bacterium]
MRPEKAQTILKWILLVGGGLAATAVFPMAMPTDWMEWTNDWLGLGPFHRSPLMEYLTRSLSALYALNGFLAIYLARDVKRYADLLAFYGWLTVGVAVALTAIDFAAPMPTYWRWGEGPMVM